MRMPIAFAPRSQTPQMDDGAASKISFRVALLASAVWLAHIAALRADDWPQWRGPNRDGVSFESGWIAQWPDSGPKILWKIDVGKGCASLAVADGLVYTMGNITEAGVQKDVVWCLNADTGAAVWKFAYAEALDPGGFPGGPCVTPCIHRGHVYTVGRKGRASCLDARTGAVLWETEPDDRFDKPYQDDFHYGGLGSSPFVDGDLLITGTRALNKDSGQLVWQLKPEDNCRWASPVLYRRNEKKYVLFFNRFGLASVDIRDGTRVWSFPLKSHSMAAAADPVVYGEQILFATTPIRRRKDPASALLRIDDSGPQIVWQNTGLMSGFQERVVWQDHVYGCDGETPADPGLKCVDLKTGEVMWSHKDFDWGQLIVSDGKLIVLRSGLLSIVEASAKQFHILAQARVVDADQDAANVSPAFSGGRIYCRASNGELACVDVTARALNSR